MTTKLINSNDSNNLITKLEKEKSSKNINIKSRYQELFEVYDDSLEEYRTYPKKYDKSIKSFLAYIKKFCDKDYALKLFFSHNIDLKTDVDFWCKLLTISVSSKFLIKNAGETIKSSDKFISLALFLDPTAYPMIDQKFKTRKKFICRYLLNVENYEDYYCLPVKIFDYKQFIASLVAVKYLPISYVKEIKGKDYANSIKSLIEMNTPNEIKSNIVFT